MKVKFVRDYRGPLTGERFYKNGDIEEFPSQVAGSLHARNAVILFEEPKPTRTTTRKRGKK